MPQVFEWIPVANSIVLFGIIAGAWIKYSTWRATEDKRKRERAEELRALIVNVCETFTNSAAYRQARDERMKEVASVIVNEAFSDRSSSFVDAKVYGAELRALHADIERLGNAITENTKELSGLSGRLSTIVFRDTPKRS